MITEKNILEYIKQNNYVLLGQINVSDEDYKELITYAEFKANHLWTNVPAKPDIKLALAMVQIAIKHYKEGRYWSCFVDEIDVKIPSSKLNYLGQIFVKTLKTYHLFELKREEENASQMYVENIKAHAFVTNYYMEGFFDFTYAFFENNLCREISDDLEDDFADLSLFMASTLKSNQDSFSATGEISIKAAKSYRLLKATRVVFANCDTNTINSLFTTALELVDKYYYDDFVPTIPQTRFERGFVEWALKQQSNELTQTKRCGEGRKLYSHKPYIKVDLENERVVLIVPPQKFRNADCLGEAKLKVTIAGYTEERDLELYKSFGIYISEQVTIPIPGVFDAVDITIEALDAKHYQIKKASYRVLNESYEMISKFSEGHNYLLIKKGEKVSWNDENCIIDSYDGYSDFQYYSIFVNEKTVVHVGKTPISLIGEFSIEPIYERVIEHFVVFDGNDCRVTCTRSHPAISFVIDKTKLRGSTLIINNKKMRLSDIDGKSCYEWIDDNSKYAINILLESVLPKEDGPYKVVLDIPGEHDKVLCKYLLLTKFNCKFDKPRYTYDSDITVNIFKDGKTVYPLSDNWISENENEDAVSYKTPVDVALKEIEIQMVEGDIYTIKMPVKVFQYGFSQQKMRCDKPKYIWYSDLKEVLYVKIPGAESASAYWGKESSLKSPGVEVEPALFRIDISEFVRKIHAEERRKWQYINVEYKDNAKRCIALPAILRNVIVEPYYELKPIDNVVCMDTELMGDAEVFVDVVDFSTKEKLVEHRKVENGITRFPELKTNTIYDFYPIMEETDDFGFDVNETKMRPVGNCVCVDETDLTGCQLPVKSIIFEDEQIDLAYDYFIKVSEKIADGIYEGTMMGYKLSGAPKGRYEKDETGKNKKYNLGNVRIEILSCDNGLELSVRLYDYIYDEWAFPWFDKGINSRYIVKPDSPILNSTDKNLKNRIVELDDENTVFVIRTQKMRRFSNAI